MRPLILPILALVSATVSACTSTAEVEDPEPSPADVPVVSQTEPGSDVESLVEREIARRQLKTKDAEALIRRGDQLMDAGDLEDARALFQKALEKTR